MRTVFIWIFLVAFTFADQEHQQAEMRALLSKAKSIKEALVILKTVNKKGPAAMVTTDSINKEQQEILKTANQLNDESYSTTVPRNGGCEPRIICEEVPVDRATSNNVMSYPQCLEVYRCGGCCQEPQFPCVPVRQEPVTFSPLLLVSLDESGRYEVQRPLTVMNHTKCECRCSMRPEQCHQEGKMLDATLCQCVKPRCTPDCLISSTCSVVEGSATPRCTCRRRLYGQKSNYCQNPNERPNRMCTRCEPANG